MPSREFVVLERAINRLKKQFLEPLPTTVGPYSDVISGRASAFRVLACGELEYFFETRCQAVANRALDGKYDRTTNLCIVAALIASHLEGPSSEDVLESEGEDGDLIVRIGAKKRMSKIGYAAFMAAVKTSYLSLIENNHGIRGRRLKKMMTPIALSVEDFDSTLISSVESYFGIRGKIAHTGSVSAKVALDPRVESTTIDGILALLKTEEARFSASRT